MAAAIAAASLAGVLTAGCASQQAAGQKKAASASTLPTAHVAIDVLGGAKLGPDGKLHDAFSPWQLTVAAGQKVEVTAYNWDTMYHSFNSATLHVRKPFAPSPKGGKPSITMFTFTAPKKTGAYQFHCAKPCDLPNGGWSMSHMGYMIGTVHVVSPS